MIRAQRLFLCLLCLWPWFTAAGGCGDEGVQVQVLGSGGPQLQDRRASSSYLIWIEGKARVLVDSGGGSVLRFGESGASMTDLDVILFTHLHVDHSADLPALIMSSWFGSRSRPLPIYGPAGNRFMPSTVTFVRGLFDQKRGIYRYLGGFVSPLGKDTYKLKPYDVEIKRGKIANVMTANGIRASAIRVVNGNVPTLAWRVEAGGKSIAFSGDTNGEGGDVEKVAQGADLLIAHNAVPGNAPPEARKLHMPPLVIGRIARAAGVRQLVLSHRMPDTLGREEEMQTAIARAYKGPIAFANDLDCFTP